MERHVDKLDFTAREDAVVDGVMANGLVDNSQPKLALEYVLGVLKAREEVKDVCYLFLFCSCSPPSRRLYRTYNSYSGPGVVLFGSECFFLTLRSFVCVRLGLASTRTR